MNKPVRKAVIAVAGFGTRFLPATKATPKEMMPIIDKPVIQYVVEEAVESGIEDIILVTSGTKRPLEDHFDDNEALEIWLKKQGKTELLKTIKRIGKLANFIYIRQKGPYGNAIPVLNAEPLIDKDEPFAVFFGDELVRNKIPRLAQMIETYNTYQDPVLAVIPVDADGTNKYAIIDPQAKVDAHTYQIKGLVEKPGPEKAKSRLGAIGAYILTPDIFKEIKTMKPGKGGEYWLPEAIHHLMKKRPIYARQIEGEYFDAGSKIGWLHANLAFAIERPEMRDDVKKLMKKLLK
ncbi:MAG: UTP--glucose-1-phosphate uridylyltransferase [Candidatus Uhrbacteria bacterium]|nr:UTP--glucose-1-phosphate uridylyltransferase [Candidatus Uhrbacteria bacterium]